MKSKLYCITDVKAGRTTEPFSAPNDDVAKRNFCMGCFASDTPVQDCILWSLAIFNIDDSDCTAFSIDNVSYKPVQPTLEEIESYLKIFQSIHNDYEDFQNKGVV